MDSKITGDVSAPGPISNRERIAYMYAWSLSFYERAKLDKFSLLRATAAELIEAINVDHEFMDFLVLPTGFFRCTYINTSISHLGDIAEKAPHTRFLVSLRCLRTEKLWVALITKEREAEEAKDIVIKNFGEYVARGKEYIASLDQDLLSAIEVVEDKKDGD